MPIKDHGEMGYSGTNGDANFSALITKLSAINYYKELFKFVYGTEEITETKIQTALSQFIRSIQSFDSKYDTGRALAANENQNFAKLTEAMNLFFENEELYKYCKKNAFERRTQKLRLGVPQVGNCCQD